MKKREIVHGVIRDDEGAHLACNKDLGMASGHQYTTGNYEQYPVTCKRCKNAMKLVFRCTGKKCPSKGKPQKTIGVVSNCTQKFTPETDDWSDLEVCDSLSGYCLECGRDMPEKVFRSLIEGSYNGKLV